MKEEAQIQMKIKKNGKRCQKKNKKREYKTCGQKHEPTTNDFVLKYACKRWPSRV